MMELAPTKARPGPATSGPSSSVGTCSVMGTASTMACVTEALGMMVPGGASAPAVTADRIRVAERTGVAAVDIAKRRLAPEQVLTPHAFENALRVRDRIPRVGVRIRRNVVQRETERSPKQVFTREGIDLQVREPLV